MTIKQLVAAVLIAAFMIAAPLSAEAQTQPAPVPASSFDGYRALAITTGVIVGAVVAAIVTDGLIIPIYAAATGAETGMMAGATMAAGPMSAAGTVSAGMGAAARHGYGLLRGTLRLLGAVSGGLYADSLYLNR